MSHPSLSSFIVAFHGIKGNNSSVLLRWMFSNTDIHILYIQRKRKEKYTRFIDVSSCDDCFWSIVRPCLLWMRRVQVLNCCYSSYYFHPSDEWWVTMTTRVYLPLPPPLRPLLHVHVHGYYLDPSLRRLANEWSSPLDSPGSANHCHWQDCVEQQNHWSLASSSVFPSIRSYPTRGHRFERVRRRFY